MSEQTENPLENLLAMWDVDSTMDSTELGKELINIPRLHAKYIRILTKHSSLSRKTAIDLTEVKKRKLEYYSGRMSQEDLDKYGLKPFKFILKSDINDYIDADEEVVKLQRKKAFHDEMVSCCNSIMREINNRHYSVKAAIDWEKLIMGN
jgi:hypothetical protein